MTKLNKYLDSRLNLTVLVSIVFLLAACGGQAAPQVSTVQQQAVEQTVSWLVEAHQNEDGGYSDFSTGADVAPSAVGGTLDAMMALLAATDSERLQAPLGFLAAHAPDVVAYATADSSQAAKAILALAGAGQDPANFGGQDLVSTLLGQLGTGGQFGEASPFGQSLAILALSTAGAEVPAAAIEWLENGQAANGSWDDGFGTADNADATAMAIMALLAAGEGTGSPAVGQAREFLLQSQLDSGAWEYSPGFGSNANSTGLVIQALDALGEDYSAAGSPWLKAAHSPLDALLAFQGESGAFQSDFGEGPFDDFFATVQSVPAVGGLQVPGPASCFESLESALACLGVS